MYDAKNEVHEFMADSRDDAVRKATEFFGVEIDELSIGEFPEGDIYGLGGRSLIVASLRDRKPPAPGRSGGRDDDRGRGDRGRRGGRDEDRSRGDRGRRGGRGGERQGRGGERSEGRGGDREASAPEAVRDEPSARELPQEPSVGTARGELGEIGRFLLGTIERMDIGPFEVSESSEDDLLVFEVTGSGAGALASGDGRSVDGLQLLANQVAKRQDVDSPRVVVDVEGNAEAREDFLAGLANRAASRGRKTGRAVALDPMNGKDRRTIHLALRDQDGVATMSVGEGRYRQVVIVPEGAPEYDQACRESDAAQGDSER